MVCPRCKHECRVSDTRRVIIGDNSPDTETKLFLEQDFTCRDPQCVDYGKVVKTIRHEQKFING